MNWFGWAIWRKSGLVQIFSWKRKEYFNILFKVIVWLFDIYQNLTSDSFFKFICNVESETMSTNFSYSVTLDHGLFLLHHNIASMYCFLCSCILSFSKLILSMLIALLAVVTSTKHMFCLEVIWVIREGAILVCMRELAFESSRETIFIKSM